MSLERLRNPLFSANRRRRGPGGLARESSLLGERGFLPRFRWQPTMAGVGKSLATRTDLLLEHRFGATAGQSPTWGQTVNLIGKHYGVREDLTTGSPVNFRMARDTPRRASATSTRRRLLLQVEWPAPRHKNPSSFLPSRSRKALPRNGPASAVPSPTVCGSL